MPNPIDLFPDHDPILRKLSVDIKELILERCLGKKITLAATLGMLEIIKQEIFLEQKDL